jgi:hypothetical protein
VVSSSALALSLPERQQSCVFRIDSIDNISTSDDIGKEYNLFDLVKSSTAAHPKGSSKVSYDLTIGRSKQHDIVLDDMSISKQHAKITFIPAVGYFLVDLGSKHGTFLNDLQLYQRRSDSTTEENGELYESKIDMNIMSMNYIRPGSSIKLGRVNCSFTMPTVEYKAAPTTATPLAGDHIVSGEQKAMDNIASAASPSIEAEYNAAVRRKRLLEEAQADAEHRKLKRLLAEQQHKAVNKAHILTSLQRQQQLQLNYERQHLHQQPVEGVGRELLQKFGWAAGQSIGKDGTTGSTEIIRVQERVKSAGLGFPNSLKSLH